VRRRQRDPAGLRNLDYKPMEESAGTRLVPEAIIERFGRAADDMLVPITEGSTLPVVSKTAQAGIIEVQRWTFLL
jgi:hypothetical protein